MPLYENSKAVIKPIVLNGHKIKKIYTWDGVFNLQQSAANNTFLHILNDDRQSNSIVPLYLGAVSARPSFLCEQTSRFLTSFLVVENTASTTLYAGVQTRIGYIQIEGVTNANRNQTVYIQVTDVKPADGVSVVFRMERTGLYAGAVAKVAVHVLKMNDTTYLLQTYRIYTNTSYDSTVGVIGRILTLRNGTVTMGGNQQLSPARTDTAVYNYNYVCYLASMNEDNTQFACFQKNFLRTISTGATYTYTWNINNFRWRSHDAVGLRATAWSQVFNNKIYTDSPFRFYESLGADYQLFRNDTGAITNRSWLGRQGDWYGAPLNSADTSMIETDSMLDSMTTADNTITTKFNNIAAFRMFGMLRNNQGVEAFIYINPLYVYEHRSSGYIYTDKIRYAELDKQNRLPMNIINKSTAYEQKLIDDVAWNTLIVNEGYMYPSFAFMKEGLLIIGMRKESYNSNVYNNIVPATSYTETIRCMAYSIQVNRQTEDISFVFEGACAGGTFRNKDLENLSIDGDAYAPYFDAHPERWYYDAFRTWVLEYDQEDTYVAD